MPGGETEAGARSNPANPPHSTSSYSCRGRFVSWSFTVTSETSRSRKLRVGIRRLSTNFKTRRREWFMIERIRWSIEVQIMANEHTHHGPPKSNFPRLNEQHPP